eukprot:COSAG01_NODE_9471_length_2437_cov_5.369119_2_plen_437_part_00
MDQLSLSAITVSTDEGAERTDGRGSAARRSQEQGSREKSALLGDTLYMSPSTERIGAWSEAAVPATSADGGGDHVDGGHAMHVQSPETRHADDHVLDWSADGGDGLDVAVASRTQTASAALNTLHATEPPAAMGVDSFMSARGDPSWAPAAQLRASRHADEAAVAARAAMWQPSYAAAAEAGTAQELLPHQHSRARGAQATAAHERAQPPPRPPQADDEAEQHPTPAQPSSALAVDRRGPSSADGGQQHSGDGVPPEPRQGATPHSQAAAPAPPATDNDGDDDGVRGVTAPPPAAPPGPPDSPAGAAGGYGAAPSTALPGSPPPPQADPAADTVRVRLRRGEGGFGMRLSPIVVRTQQRRRQRRQQHSGEVSQRGGQGPSSEEGAPMVNLHTLLEVSDVLRDLPAARGGVAARDVLLEVRGDGRGGRWTRGGGGTS